MLWTDGSVPFPFGQDGSGVLANCSLCGTEATFFFSAGPVCLSFSAKACSILRTLCWSQKHLQVCDFSVVPCSLSPFISRIHPHLFSDWTRTFSSKFFDTQVPSISTEELVLLGHARCVPCRLHCNGHSLLLNSYQFRICKIENPSCSACVNSSQGTSHLILHCPATDSLHRSLLGDSLSLYDLWSRSLGVARLLGLHGLPACFHPLEGVK